METQLLAITSDSHQFHQKAEKDVTPTSQHWVVTDNETAHRIKYIFRPNGELLIAPLGVRQATKAE